jgi:hypothetical protein
MPEPTLVDVLGRLDNLDRVLSLELRALRAEVTAGFAEVRVDISALRQDIQELDKSMRDLWTEHLDHSHPEPGQ